MGSSVVSGWEEMSTGQLDSEGQSRAGEWSLLHGSRSALQGPARRLLGTGGPEPWPVGLRRTQQTEVLGDPGQAGHGVQPREASGCDSK